MSHASTTLPDEFQNQVINLVSGFVQVDLVRFLVFFPRQNFQQSAYSIPSKETMEDEYQRVHWHKDPMHPTLYEDTDTIVVSDSMLMSLAEWQQHPFYLEFLKPHGLEHDMDVFFRKDGRIVGVLTMIRTDADCPFTPEDVAVIEKLHPFMEYTLDKVFLSERISERKQLIERYDLTLREMDVLEYALSGLSNKELARYLKISLPTLRTHLQNIYLKVDVHSTSELISRVLRENNMHDYLASSSIISEN